NTELLFFPPKGSVRVGQVTGVRRFAFRIYALVNQSKALTFLSTGNIVLGANGLTDAGTVTMTTSGTGAITTNGPLTTTGNRNIEIGRASCRERAQLPVDAGVSETIIKRGKG